ncbi:unnamed protein product [Ceutorhynchus assimilis]|uniref:Death domain-containing protein n=1 Tax=Ceutorhynchus assimilis TaxID=467358 RepID=A0A9N9QP11_9CUCU|nr:unnamed protein product [Ceutorhynchus assimilis]
MARQKADLPLSDYGPIILVATHVDLSRAAKTQQGEWLCPDAQKTLETVQKHLPHVPNLMDVVIIMDSNVPASFAFKQFKVILGNVKQNCIQQTIGTWTGLLESALSWMGILRMDHEQFPVITRARFSDLLRGQVNLLASDEHIQELLNQLHVMGEVYIIDYLIVLSVPWLGTQLLGELLSTNFISHARVMGVYTAEDFQSCYTQCDSNCVLELLQCLDLCVQCDVDGEIEYEFPIYIQTETLNGLWVSNDANSESIYGGSRLYTSSGIFHLFKAIFSHIQVNLRKNLGTVYTDNSDLFQWSSGSKYCNMELESLITLEENQNSVQFIEIKVRGPNKQSAQSCFYFLDNIMGIVNKAIAQICPGLLQETHILSPEELRLYSENPHCYSPQIITTAIMEAESTLDVILYNPNTNSHETISQIVMFDDMDLAPNIQWGCALKVQQLPGPVKLRLCGFLDPPEPHGRDWCLLALRLGLCQKKIAALASQHSSHTMRLLTSAECTIGALITSLHELDRQDAAEIVLKCAPVFEVSLEHAQ